MKISNQTSSSTKPNDHPQAQESHLTATSLIQRYRTMIYIGLLLIILITLGNALYLRAQVKSQLLSQQAQYGLESMLSLNKTISVSLNHIDTMRNAIETAYLYPQLAPNKVSLDFLASYSQQSPANAPWENLPQSLKDKIGQLYVRSNARDYSFDQLALLTMASEVVSTHAQHDDFQWSYYYDAQEVITYIYPWLSYLDLMAATNTTTLDDALDVVFEAGGTYPLSLINPEANPERNKVWTTPYMDAGGKGMMVSLLAPVYHDSKYIGGVGTDITLKVLDKILTKRPLETGRLVIVDQQGLVVGDSKGTLQGKTESVSQQSVLALSEIGDAHQATHGRLNGHPNGYWISFTLMDTPWRLVLEITNSDINRHVLTTLLPNLILATVFTAILLFVVLYQHWNFSQPALQLAQYVEELPTKNVLTIPDIPTRWEYWFKRAADTERDRRNHLDTIELQTHELEQRVHERTIELKETLETLKATQEELVRSEKLSGLGSLVAGVAHELNTPIGNAMMVATSLKDFNQEFIESTKQGLRRSVLDNYIAQSTEGSESIERNLRRASELISSFKQVAVDQSSYQRREFALDEILHELQITMSPNLSRSQVSLEMECEKSVHMNSYPGPLTQVLMNLLSNALTHAFSEQEHKTVCIRGTLVEQKAIITVEDNGHGISQENISKIFDPFFTTRLGQGGSGLGLNIVYNLVTDLLGGDIRVESELGLGTTFILTLPISAPNSETEPE